MIDKDPEGMPSNTFCALPWMHISTRPSGHMRVCCTANASAVQDKYNSMKKASDKEKFQVKIAKSYKDMLSALKEGFASDAQRKAAFASGYKEKGKKKKEDIDEAGFVGRKDPMPAGKELAKLMKKKSKKENTILDRVGKKIKERKNG